MINLITKGFAMANVTCEYDNSIGSNSGNLSLSGNVQQQLDSVTACRRVRRSEATLRQAAECVSRGETFQTVSDMFNIPISTIRFYMARKGILPRRKRGRTAIVPYVIAGGSQISNSISFSNNSTSQSTTCQQPLLVQNRSRSESPTEPPYHFANYKLPELKPKLV
ncbi:uncharacterized protein LOC131440285 [Malaya genurostris]|uniref:uncharacterized protein LOC131440285 n=1 Tax=Malaya genurostris TaxID=325434 RepID=UPI0026F3F7C9|nr:uncharacterized protein LOC131440285 [Malaya genurostris]